MENWEQQENGRRFVFIIACLLILTGVFALLMAINGTISNLQLLWFGLGLFLLGFFPELVNSINNSNKKLKTNLEFRLICWIFCTIIGLAIPFVLNTFDPVSTYLGIIFLGLNALHILPFILSNKNKRN